MISARRDISYIFDFDMNIIMMILEEQQICDIADVLTLLKTPQEKTFLNRLYVFFLMYDLDFIKEHLTDFMMSYSHYLNDNIYIAIFYYYFNKYDLSNTELSRKVKYLYLDLNVDSLFRPDKYMSHFGRAFYYCNDLSKDVSSDILDYVKANLDDDMTPLEIAISIYVLLCKILKYDVSYTFTRNNNETVKFDDVTLENNEVVCYTFAMIYYKLLEYFGINANLCGDEENHMYVNLQIGNMRLSADGVRACRNRNGSYRISDLAAIKYNLPMTGFYLEERSYDDVDWIIFYKELLEKTINKVYKRFGLKIDFIDQIESFIDDYQDMELRRNKDSYTELFHDEMSSLNAFMAYFDYFGSVERGQIFNKFSEELLIGIPDSNYEVSLLYSLDSPCYIHRLITYRDANFYYLEMNGYFRCYSLDELLDIIEREGLIFKSINDVDALSLPRSVAKNIINRQIKSFAKVK